VGRSGLVGVGLNWREVLTGGKFQQCADVYAQHSSQVKRKNHERSLYNNGLSEHLKHLFTWSLWVTAKQFPEIVNFFYWVFQMNKSLVLIAVIAAAALAACGKKEEAPAPAPAPVAAPAPAASEAAPAASEAAPAASAVVDAAAGAAADAAKAAASK
jgi:hypothetical protein